MHLYHRISPNFLLAHWFLFPVPFADSSYARFVQFIQCSPLGPEFLLVSLGNLTPSHNFKYHPYYDGLQVRILSLNISPQLQTQIPSGSTSPPWWSDTHLKLNVSEREFLVSVLFLVTLSLGFPISLPTLSLRLTPWSHPNSSFFSHNPKPLHCTLCQFHQN